MLDDALNWVFWIGILLWLLAALATLWLWGGARRSALGHIAAGALLLVSGALFTHVVLINVYARMDNAYLANAWFGWYLILAGTILLIGALAGYGLPAWLAAILWVACAALYLYGAPWLSKMIQYPDSGYLLVAALLVIAVPLYVAARSHVGDALVALALAGASLTLVWWAYGAGLRAFIPLTAIGPDEYKPPVLGIGVFLLCQLLATALYFAGRLIHGLEVRQSHAPTPA